MIARLYLYDQSILIPTVAQNEEGVYFDTQPVHRIPVKDMERWKDELHRAIKQGNRVVPTPERAESGGSAILELLKLQKWTLFEKKAIMYTVHFGSSYTRLYRTGRGPDGMWLGSATSERMFDPRTPKQYIVDAIAQDVFKQPEAHPVKVGGLIPLKLI